MPSETLIPRGVGSWAPLGLITVLEAAHNKDATRLSVVVRLVLAPPVPERVGYMTGFSCGICDTIHPSTEFDGATTKLPEGGGWIHAGKEATLVGFCPIVQDWKAKLPDGTIVFTDDIGTVQL